MQAISTMMRDITESENLLNELVKDCITYRLGLRITTKIWLHSLFTIIMVMHLQIKH